MLSNEKMEIFHPSCNIDTVKDGRGGIFTWVPQDAIMEFNLLYLHLALQEEIIIILSLLNIFW